MDILESLFLLKDEEYKKFYCRLMPTVNSDNVIGVRMPNIRKLAKEISKKECAIKFRRELPHKFYEENNLHVFLINEIKDYDECVREIKYFLPFVDNWATCDSLRPKCFIKNKNKLIFEIKKWITSDHAYTIRFAIEMLMIHYLDDSFDKSYLDMVACIRHNDYYVKMMVAWYFATALAKHWNDTFFYLEQEKIEKWTYNKIISKAIESFQITNVQKVKLKSLKTDKTIK